jgi:antitoxin ParD1/3/4
LAFNAITAILCAGGAMPTRNVSLPKALDLFVNRTIKTGRYDNASEVIRAGLRLLAREEKESTEKFVWLKAAIAEGIASLDNAQDGDMAVQEIEEYMAGLVAARDRVA